MPTGRGSEDRTAERAKRHYAVAKTGGTANRLGEGHGTFVPWEATSGPLGRSFPRFRLVVENADLAIFLCNPLAEGEGDS